MMVEVIVDKMVELIKVVKLVIVSVILFIVKVVI